MAKTKIKIRRTRTSTASIRGGTGSTPRPSPRTRQREPSRAGRSTPRSRNPEVLLLSAVINTGDVLTCIDAGITSEWFEHDDSGPYQRHWTWLAAFYDRHGQAPSEAAFLTQFPAFPLLDTKEIAHAIDAMRGSYSKRRMADTIQQAARLLKVGEIEEATTLVRSHVADVDARIAPTNTMVSSLHDTDGTIEAIEKMMHRKRTNGQPGLPTGFRILDQRTGGIQSGQLWLFAARLSNGKTWTLVNIAARAAMQGANVHFWSLEQTKYQIDIRLHVFLAQLMDNNKGKLSISALNTGEEADGSELDLAVYRDYVARIGREVPGEVQCHQPGRSGVSPRRIAAAAERDHPDLILVDYISLLTHDGPETEWRASAKLSAGLKAIATSLDIPVVAAAQINREGERGRKPPRVSNLADSDNYGRDADVVVTMAKQSPSVSKMLTDKDRHGQGHYSWWVEFLVDSGVLRACNGDRAHELMDDDEDQAADAEELG